MNEPITVYMEEWICSQTTADPKPKESSFIISVGLGQNVMLLYLVHK